jgi:hypothetical protein
MLGYNIKQWTALGRNPVDDRLAAHARQLLAGTGLTPADAARIAGDPDAEVPDTAAAAAQAIRDGWAVGRQAADDPGAEQAD